MAGWRQHAGASCEKHKSAVERLAIITVIICTISSKHVSCSSSQSLAEVISPTRQGIVSSAVEGRSASLQTLAILGRRSAVYPQSMQQLVCSGH